MEAILEKAENGGDIMVMPGDGDDSGFDKAIVTYDENTTFAVMAIYGGGETYDMSDAAAGDLAAGQSVRVWGNAVDGGLAAARICIVKVE